ncbi:MAG: Flp family type IVb pilin [Pseudomonadota bacterium]
MLKLLIKLKTNTSGATAIEYGLIAALIAVGLIAALTTVGGDLGTLFERVGTETSTAVDNLPD